MGAALRAALLLSEVREQGEVDFAEAEEEDLTTLVEEIPKVSHRRTRARQPRHWIVAAHCLVQLGQLMVYPMTSWARGWELLGGWRF